MTLNIKIPANTSATIMVPGTQADKVTENGLPIGKIFKNIRQDKNNVVVETGSGEYRFAYDYDGGH